MLSVLTEEVTVESAVSIQKTEHKHSGAVPKKYFKYKLK